MKPGRNDPCICGSGKKYKKCCGKTEPGLPVQSRQYQNTAAQNSPKAGAAPAQDECNRLIELYNAGRHVELEKQTRLLLERYPDSGFVWKMLSASLLMQGKDALLALQKAAKFFSDDAVTHYNLGNSLKKLDRLDEAETSYRRALQVKPDYIKAYNNLGSTLNELERLDEAEAICRQALLIEPDSAEAHSNLGDTLLDLGRLDEAEASCRRALQLKPDFAEAHLNLGNVLSNMGRMDEAEASYRRALQIRPDYLEAHSNLGCLLKDIGRLDEAETNCRRALEIKPDFAEAYNNLGGILRNQGRLDEAETNFRRALEINPNFAGAHSNMLFCLSHNESLEEQVLFAEHIRYGEQFESPLRADWSQHTNLRTPERCLQIGFVSGDFFKHAVAEFIEPLLAYLSGYSQLSLHAYANQTISDSTTQRLRGYFSHWYSIASLSDAVLAKKIRADGIDILIDLSGHTGQNRLLTFARKPAPLQASWIGYPGTTGLSAMDYYLADRFLLPPGQLDGQFTEKIVRLPASAPFLPYKGAPLVNTLPALSNGYITFGSFNRLSKLSTSAISLWSQLLRALPSSRMLLGAMPQDGNVDALVDLFAQEGIAQERLIFYPRCGMDAYLSLYHQVDICLDAFPYNGGTTTCHALWMGIPTLTLAGNTLPGRVGAALLTQVGLETFVAHDAADFVKKGLNWACNTVSLADIRAELRERFAQSPRGQPAMIASGFERALRIMWQRWCAGLPTESFEVNRQDMDNMMQKAST